MTPLSILRYPDARLKVACAPVVAFDDELRRLSLDLLQAMRAAPGVGMTAAHVGILKRVLVIELQPGDTIRTLINPEIVWSSAETERHMEGSVCMPGATEEVVRPPASVTPTETSTVHCTRTPPKASLPPVSSMRSISSTASSGCSACRS